MKPFGILNDELFGPVCYITENEGPHKRVRFEIKEGVNKSKGVEIILREESEQYVFVINFDKGKLSFKGADPLIREKWHLIVSFLKSRISLVDPDRLKSVTVMVPQNSRSGIRTKKVKLLITLFLLLVSENYILLQRTTGYTAIEKEGVYSSIFNIKAALSKFCKRTKPSKRSIYHLFKTSAKRYDFEALSDLKNYDELEFEVNRKPQRKLESIPSTPMIRNSPSENSLTDLSPIYRSKSPKKKRQTRIDMQQLIKMFQIEDDPQNSKSKEELSKALSINIEEDAKPKDEVSIERKNSGIQPYVIPVAETDAKQKEQNHDSSYNLSPIQEVDKSNISSTMKPSISPNNEQQDSSMSRRQHLADQSMQARSTMRKTTRMKVGTSN